MLHLSILPKSGDFAYTRRAAQSISPATHRVILTMHRGIPATHRVFPAPLATHPQPLQAHPLSTASTRIITPSSLSGIAFSVFWTASNPGWSGNFLG